MDYFNIIRDYLYNDRIIYYYMITNHYFKNSWNRIYTTLFELDDIKILNNYEVYSIFYRYHILKWVNSLDLRRLILISGLIPLKLLL
jgi:hypothetical protein